MSCQTSIIYGYGFPFDISNKNLISFIKSHKKSFCMTGQEKRIFYEISSAKDVSELDVDDLFKEYICQSSGMEGRGAVVSNIMARETGIRFEYQTGQSDCYSEPSILLSECCPWLYNDKEKALTEPDLHEICLKYMEELNISGVPNYVRIEYFG